jgi:prevent-host-death family protein
MPEDVSREDASKVRNHFRRRLDAVVAGAHVIITRWGDDTAVLVPVDWYERAREALGEPEAREEAGT